MSEPNQTNTLSNTLPDYKCMDKARRFAKEHALPETTIEPLAVCLMEYAITIAEALTAPDNEVIENLKHYDSYNHLIESFKREMPNINDKALRKLCAMSQILAVAGQRSGNFDKNDPEITYCGELEHEAIRKSMSDFNVPDVIAKFVADIASASPVGMPEACHMARVFMDDSSQQERERVVDMMMNVAQADGDVNDAEKSMISIVKNYLRIEK